MLGMPGPPAQKDLICALQTRIAEGLLAVHSGRLHARWRQPAL